MFYPTFGGYGLYILFSLPALLLGFWARAKVQSAFRRYSQVRSGRGLTGAQIAHQMLQSNSLYDVEIEETRGFLSDHYDPSKKVLRLSPEVYRGNSLAAAGIAAHEAGHALQHAGGYAMLQLRTAIIPSVQIGSWLGPIIFMVGLFLNTAFGDQIAWAGLLLFSATALFALITLPVEFNASRRAKAWLTSTGTIHAQESKGVSKVLDAAALTYVAAAIQAVSTVLYYLFILMGRSRD
jgi:Zn-dependent membrane protease YugP